MKALSSRENKSLYAIVSVGYNRLQSQRRLLENLENADYSGYNNVPLIISIDCSGNEELYNYVRNFEWSHGDKYVIIREERMGLKDHILACGDLTQYFKGIILLEDDLYLNKYFYHYVMQMETAYGECESVACIGMYKNEMNGFCWLPCDCMTNGADVIANQSVCTWGEAWNDRMWSSFREWYKKEEIDWDRIDMPDKEKLWDRAWSKYFDAYMIQKNLFCIYPNISLSTNISVEGEHSGAKNGDLRFQSSLLCGDKTFNTLPFDKLLKYDAYGNSLNLFDALGLKREETCVDLYGNRDNKYGKRYYLSVNPKPFKAIKSYGLILRPMEMNIINGIDGIDIFLYDTMIPAKRPRSGGLTRRVMYYQKGFNSLYLWQLIKGNIKILIVIVENKIKRKLNSI